MIGNALLCNDSSEDFNLQGSKGRGPKLQKATEYEYLYKLELKITNKVLPKKMLNFNSLETKETWKRVYRNFLS